MALRLQYLLWHVTNEHHMKMELHISRKKCHWDYLKAFKKGLQELQKIFFDWVLLYNMAKLISEKVSFNNFNNVFPTPFLHPILICFSDKTCLKKRAPSSMVLESQDSTKVLGRSQWFIISKIGHLFFFNLYLTMQVYIQFHLRFVHSATVVTRLSLLTEIS